MAKNEHRVFKFKRADGTEYVIGDGGKSLELTPEKLNEAIRNQAAWEPSSPHLPVSPQTAHIQKAAREAMDWLEAARAVELELHQPHSKQETKDLKPRYNHLLKLLAEALATCGNYEEALAVLPRHEVELRREFQAINKAIWRDDSLRCSAACAKAFDADPTIRNRERVVRYIASRKHGGIIPLIACTSCGALNARPADGELAKQMAARSRAQQLTKGKSPAEARRALVDAKLTSENIFK